MMSFTCEHGTRVLQQVPWSLWSLPPPAGFKSFSLTSVELQMLTNSCVKLQTVHSIPMTMNKEGQFHAVLSLGCISIKFFSLTFDLSAAPTDDESSGLYGFLNVIVHSASGLKQSLSKRPNIM